MIDSHCHLDSSDFDADRLAVIDRALEAGVTRMLAIGTGDGPPDLEAAIRLAEAHPSIHATVGVHPHDAGKWQPDTLRRLEELLAHPKVLGIGEIGLDYHYNFSPPDQQRRVFREQLELARSAGRPIIIHTREAWDDTFALIEEVWQSAPAGGIMHCFSGGPGEARRSLDLGFHISFSGIVTFPKAAAVHEAARLTPDDRLLIETDAPYLAPIPHRGKRNEPAFVAHTAQRLAALRGIDYAALVHQTDRNFEALFTPGTFTPRAL